MDALLFFAGFFSMKYGSKPLEIALLNTISKGFDPNSFLVNIYYVEDRGFSSPYPHVSVT